MAHGSINAAITAAQAASDKVRIAIDELKYVKATYDATI